MFNAFIESKLNEPFQNIRNFDITATKDSAYENNQDCSKKFSENLNALLNPFCE